MKWRIVKKWGSKSQKQIDARITRRDELFKLNEPVKEQSKLTQVNRIGYTLVKDLRRNQIYVRRTKIKSTEKLIWQVRICKNLIIAALRLIKCSMNA